MKTMRLTEATIQKRIFNGEIEVVERTENFLYIRRIGKNEGMKLVEIRKGFRALGATKKRK